jgi:TPR repeat protein
MTLFRRPQPQLPVPRILHVAAAAGNVEGTLAIARMHEMRGDIDKAVGQWKLAAKANSAQAQFRIGELFYQGNTDLGRDSEEVRFAPAATPAGVG